MCPSGIALREKARFQLFAAEIIGYLVGYATFTNKTQLDRLVGQVESLKPDKNNIVVVLCGDTNPTLISRFKEKYRIDVSLWSHVVLIIKNDKG
jgi:hypothetical protein